MGGQLLCNQYFLQIFECVASHSSDFTFFISCLYHVFSSYSTNFFAMLFAFLVALLTVYFLCLSYVQLHVKNVSITRTTHAHDASRRSKRHARMGRAAQVSGVARLV